MKAPVSVARYFIEGPVNPQAIFWRPITYFSENIRAGQDDLDEFDGVSFCIGNHLQFDIRRYRGHSPETSTLYLSITIEDQSEISEYIDIVIAAFAIPKGAVAWRRGWEFQIGVLTRPQTDRLRESEARIIALKIAATQPKQQIATSRLKQLFPTFFSPSKVDLQKSETRSREQKWQQVVGNVITHRKTKSGIFEKGLAERTQQGLRITSRGIDYLKSIGFLSS